VDFLTSLGLGSVSFCLLLIEACEPELTDLASGIDRKQFSKRIDPLLKLAVLNVFPD